MYISAAIYHIRKRTPMGRNFLTHPRDLLCFLICGNLIETKLELKIYNLLHTKREIQANNELNNGARKHYEDYINRK